MEREEIRKNLAVSFSELHDLDTVVHLNEAFQGETRILLCLQDVKNPLAPSDLSELLHVSRARITAALASLRKKGLIRMDACKVDRRRMHVVLTEDGRCHAEKKNAEATASLDALIGGLGERDALEFIRLLRVSAKVLSESASAPFEASVSKHIL